MTAPASLTRPHKARLTVENFMTLDRAGAFAAYAKTELIDGTIYVVNAQYSEHMKAKVGLLRRLADACVALGGGLEAWSQGSIEMAPSSMPEPDILITREEPTTGPVRAETVALIVEVADTTLKFDMDKKAKTYARQGITEYWVADLGGGMIHQHWSPAGGAYAERCVVAFGERIEAVTIAGLVAKAAGLT